MGEREGQRQSSFRQARTCYDHLAGAAGVQLLDALREHGWIDADSDTAASRPAYHLTTSGEVALRARGVNLAKARRARRRFAYGCPDGTACGMHLGGSLGAQIFEALRRNGIVRRQGETRVVSLQQPLASWLDFPAISE